MPFNNQYILQQASDAEIIINSETTITSASNDILLSDYNLSLNLTNTDEDSRFISVTTNDNYISQVIGGYVARIANFLSNINNSGDAHSEQTIDNFKSGLKSLEGGLKQIGITINYKKMTLSVDYDKLKQSINSIPDFVQNIISGTSGLVRFTNVTLNEYLQTPIDLYSIPRSDYSSYSYIPVGYNAYNPFDVRTNLLKL